MSPLSIEYCRRAKSHLAAIGSPLAAGTLPEADFFPAAGGGSSLVRLRRVAGRLVRAAPIRTATTSRRFWAAHAARIRAIEARLPWKRGGIMVSG